MSIHLHRICEIVGSSPLALPHTSIFSFPCRLHFAFARARVVTNCRYGRKSTPQCVDRVLMFRKR